MFNKPRSVISKHSLAAAHDLDRERNSPLWFRLGPLLLLAVVPPLVFDGDLRGLHDKAADTLVIRT